jgi:hypothetical protein
MKKQIQLALAGAAVGVASLVAVSNSATAQVVSFPRIARGINTWMARAVDECSAPTTTVLTPGSPTSGCIQSNAVTDNTLGMKFTKLNMNTLGHIRLTGTGFALGDEVRVRLTLRVTRNAGTKHPPAASTRVTFADTTVDCPKAPDAFNARPNGAIVGFTDLATCLDTNSGLASGNIEVIDVSLINALTGKVVAVPGVLR